MATRPADTHASVSSGRGRLSEGASLLISNSRFRRYYLARLINSLGTTVAPLGLAFAVLADGGGPAALGIVLAGGPLVSLAVMPIAGVAGDRLARNQISAACHLTSGIAQTIAASLVLTGHSVVWALALLSLVTGAATAFLRPAIQGLLAQIVTPEQLIPAGAAIQLAMNFWALLGPALAGVAIISFGPGWILAFDACSFFIASTLFAALHVPNPRGEQTSRRRSRTAEFVADMRTGLTYFMRRRWLWTLSALSAVDHISWAVSVTVLGPVFARAHLHGALSWGIVTSAIGIGLAIGSLTSLLTRPTRIGLIMCACSATSMVFLATMAANLPLWAIATAAVLTGAASTLQVITWTALTQAIIPAGQFARTSSLYTMITTLGLPIAYLGAGPLTEITGLRAAIWACITAQGLAVLTAYAVPDVRQLAMPTDTPC